jgi:hypothetical protein
MGNQEKSLSLQPSTPFAKRALEEIEVVAEQV